VRAICVTSERKLQVRDVPSPDVPPPGHVTVKMGASATTATRPFWRDPVPRASRCLEAATTYGVPRSGHSHRRRRRGPSRCRR
jgi:hypothetical protein